MIGGLKRVSGDEDVLAGSVIVRSPGLLARSCQMTGDSTKKIPLFARDLGGSGGTGKVMSLFYFGTRLLTQAAWGKFLVLWKRCPAFRIQQWKGHQGVHSISSAGLGNKPIHQTQTLLGCRLANLGQYRNNAIKVP